MGTPGPEAVPPKENDLNSYYEERGRRPPPNNHTDENHHAAEDTERQQEPSPCSICEVCSSLEAPGPVEQAVEELDQAAAERELFELLRRQGVKGPVWETVVVALSEYATQVLDPWIWTGEVYSKLTEKKIRLGARAAEREALTANRDYRQEIIDRTVVGALTKFRDHMRAGKGWDPCQGAKLRTYFITACLYEFPQAFGEDLRWRRTHQPLSSDYDDIADLLDTRDASRTLSVRDPLETVTDRLMIQAYLATLTRPDKIIVLAVAQGYTHGEIAHLFPDLALTPKAVERRLQRIRKHARLNLRSLG